MKKALIIVDMQNDFMPGGPLGVAEADTLAPLINASMDSVDYVITTQDWHPSNHVSFAASHEGKEIGDFVQTEYGDEQFLWPAHCVQNTKGADLVDDLDESRLTHRIYKGESVEVDSYSGFFDNNRRKGTGLLELLRDLEVDELFVCGVATDYCVKFTVLDALSEGFKVSVATDIVRGVDVSKGDSAAALKEMEEAGASLVILSEMRN